MKKLLSLLLAVAMIVSCVSMVSFVINAADDSIGVQFTAKKTFTGDAYAMTSSGGGAFSAADVAEGYLNYSFNIYNPTNHSVKINVSIQAVCNWSTGAGWTDPSGGSKTVTIPAGEQAGGTISIAVDANNEVAITKTVSGTQETINKNVSALFLRVNSQGANNLYEGESVVFLQDDANDAIYAVASNSNFQIGAVTELPTPEPEKLGDGTLEAGTRGWGTIHGGSFSAVADPDDAENTVGKVTIAGKYNSIAFDLGPYIIDDADYNYAGNGAGKYTVSFKFKAESFPEGYADNARFTVNINSVAHYNASQINTILGTPDKYALNSYISSWEPSNGAVITEEWQTWTGTIDVTETYLEIIKGLRESSDSLAPKAYQLMLRLDGASNAYASANYFNYFVDDVTIEKVVEPSPTAVVTTAPAVTTAPTTTTVPATTTAPAVTTAPAATATPTPTPTPTPAPTPNAIEINVLQDTAYYLISGTKVMDADDIKDGVLTKEITIENVGENDINVQFCIQATVKNSEGKDTWSGFANEDGYVEIAAGDKETLTVEVEFDNGVTSILDQDVTVDKLFFRLNFNNNKALNEGDAVLIYGDQDVVAAYAARTSSDKITYTTKILDIKVNGSSNPSNTGDALPVALIATVLVATAGLVVVAKKRKED